MYNVPSRTGQSVTADTQLRIAHELKNIFATKEASGNFDLISQIIKNKPEDFMVISGDDPITLQMIAAGAEGLISVVSNAYPLEYSNMVRHCLQGNFEMAESALTEAMRSVSPLEKRGLSQQFEAVGDGFIKTGDRKSAERTYRQAITLDGENQGLVGKLTKAQRG